MIYQVNIEPLGIADTVQIIELLNDCGYDEKFQWHARMIDDRCRELELIYIAVCYRS